MKKKSSFSTIIVSFLVNLSLLIAVILFSPGLPPKVKYESYKISPPIEVESKKVSHALDKADILIENEFYGAESIAIRNNDELYTGVIGGQILRIKERDVKVIAQVGKKCNSIFDVGTCGRPLGMRFNKKGLLIFADAYFGIMSLNVESGKLETIVPIHEEIDRKKQQIPDDLDIGEDGSIYWSDASTTTQLHNLFVEMLGHPSGRVLKFDPKSNKTTVLMDNLHMSNGVQLTKNEESLLVSETFRSRVWRIFLKGSRKGEKEVFIDGLPGLPDNIRRNGKGGYYISCFMNRDESNPSAGDLLGKLPLVRKLLLRTQSILQLFLSFLNRFFPNNAIIEIIADSVCHLGPIGNPQNFLKKAVVIEVNENGELIRSLESKNGEMKTVTETSVGKDYTYFGSFTERKLWRVRNDYLNTD